MAFDKPVTHSGPSDSSYASAQLFDNKVRLRLCAGGDFVKTPEGEWKYVGGQVYNESVAAGVSYADFMFKMSEKCGPVQIKYQAPGEDLDPQNLVSITDDSDLQELYDEYSRALQRCGNACKTVRIKAFACPAEDTAFTEEDYMEQEYASYCERRATDLGTADGHSSWGSNHSTSSEPSASMMSANPSSDTEYHWYTSGHVPTTSNGGNPYSIGTDAVPYVPLINAQNVFANMVWQNISKQPAYQALAPGQPQVWPGEGSEDIYYGGGNENTMKKEVLDNTAPMQGEEIYKLLKDDIAGNLPSHISAFGDTCTTGGEGHINLPSHISAFGDTSSGDNARFLDLVASATPAAGELMDIAAGGMFNNEGLKRRHSKEVITQVFDGSMDAEHLLGDCPILQVCNDMQIPEEGLMATVSPTSLRQLGLSVHHVAKDEVTVLRKIGEGAFGEVSQAQVPLFGIVAVKWLKRERFSKHSISFQNEARTLSELNHPNIIRIYGLVTETNDETSPVIGIMTEFVRGGSLSHYLRRRRTLSLKERCQLALYAANGMAYLHEKRVVHFDLKPDNLLVDGDGDNVTVKVADFGLSKHKWNSFVSSCRDLRGTLPYMAPELVANPEQVSEKADIWSMGVVMWEMFTLEIPFQELQAQQILMGLMHGNLHLTIPESCEPEWRGLIEACMDANPGNRPTFRQLAKILAEVVQQLSSPLDSAA